jgi:hypothetical protein
MLAAKNQATRIYLPLLVVTNLIYVALLGNMFGTTTTTTAGVLSSNWGIAGTIVTWIEQAYSYVGILDHHAANASAGNSNSKHKDNKHNKHDLAGGSSLDLLAVTLVVQFGSVLHSKAWLWLTVVGVPVVAAYQLYRAVGGSSNSNSNSTNKSNSNSNNKSNSNKSSDNSNADGTDDDPMAAKRRRRAEKRRQKWG